MPEFSTPCPKSTDEAHRSPRRHRHAIRLFGLVAALMLTQSFAAAQDRTDIRLVTDKALSPDGTRLAFTWRGDVWTVPTNGGAARRMTFHPASDRSPRFSADGKSLAFLSDRDGASSQIWVMPADGGAPRRITRHTDGYRLGEWLRDGSGFLVSVVRDDHWYRRSAPRFYTQPINGTSAPTLLFDAYGANATLSPRGGNQVLFTREATRTYRKGYEGSQESQVWLYNRRTEAFRLLHGEGNGGCRWPMWNPNGGYYYVSQAKGAWNLHHVRAGREKPLTNYTDDGVLFPVISRDGSTIVFTRLFDIYRMDTKTGDITKIDIHDAGDPTVAPTRRLRLTAATNVAFTDDAREVAVVAGGDIWVMDTELREPVRVTDTPGEESSPVFSQDHGTLFFISTVNGQVDVCSVERENPKKYWWQNREFVSKKLTDDTAPESELRLDPTGKRLMFYRDRGDVVSMNLDGSDAKTIIEAWLAPAYDVSPDGKWVVYARSDDDYNRDVWIKPIDGSREPFNLSCHPDNDGSPTWSPDGKRIAFTGRRWGTESDVVYVNLRKNDDEETSRQRKLEKALEKMKGRDKKKKKKGGKGKGKSDAKDDEAATGDGISGVWEGTVYGIPQYPDGRAFTIELKLDGKTISGSWSNADGNGGLSGTFDPASGKLTFTMDSPDGQISATATLSGGRLDGKWNLGALASGRFEATRAEAPTAKNDGAGNKNTDAAKSDDDKKKDKKKDDKEDKNEVEVRIDFDGIRDRVRRISVPDSREFSLSWSPNGKKLYFSATVRGKSGLHSVEFPDKMTPKFVTGTRLASARWIKDGKRLVGRQGGTPATMTESGKVTTYALSAHTELDVAARNREVFEASWRTMRDRWYDERHGNNDWSAIHDKYADVTGTLDGDVLSRAINMMLGELNGSHLGFTWMERSASMPSPHAWSERTRHLGVRFDREYDGEGLRIRDVIKNGPASREDSRLEAGEIILSIDGKKTDRRTDVAVYLSAPPEHVFELEVRNAEGEVRTVRLRPTTSGRVRSMLYDMWLDKNRAMVDKLSGNRFGYLHIRAMSGASLLKFDAELYRVGAGKDGLVIDVRQNGGGSITDHLLTCLCQPTHAITRSRGGGEGYPHDRRIYATWDKPIVVLCNQNSFSNAEIFSHAVKTLGRGQVVGVPTAGGVISTGGTTIMGLGRLRLPFRGWYLLDGEDMELNGAVPHHIVWPLPGELPAGKDRQIEKAVDVLSEDVAAWQAKPRPKLRKATERTR